MNDVFKQTSAEDAAVKTAFYDARDRMSRILEAAIETQEQQEKTDAVDAERRKHWVKPERVDNEMRGIYKVRRVALFLSCTLHARQLAHGSRTRRAQSLRHPCAWQCTAAITSTRGLISSVCCRMSTARTSSSTISIICKKR